MQLKVLDIFEDLSGWSSFASGEATLDISQDKGSRGKAMRLDFDFHGGGGFVVARKILPLELPESYVINFNIRGISPSNIFEFKLADASNQNVWRYRVEQFNFSDEWKPLKIRNSQIEFAWGPLGGGPAGKIETIEMVIAAGPGGKGTVWIDELWFQDITYRSTPIVQASSALPDHDPRNAVTPCASWSWKSLPADEPQWLLIDFQQEREYGGLVIHWEKDFQAEQFNVQLSIDGDVWNTVYKTDQADSERSYIFLPQSISRYIRLNLLRSVTGKGFGIQSIEIKPYDFSRTINHFFQNIAREQKAGLYPKYFLGKQTYWTTVGTGEGHGQALFNEEGMVEVDKGFFSIEPFLYFDNRLITWLDAELSQGLMQEYLPVPFSQWRIRSLAMKVTAFTDIISSRPILFIRYQIDNTWYKHQHVILFAAIRPFQVTPTWQNWGIFGGVSQVHEISFSDGALMINGKKAVIPICAPSGFGAAAFDQGTVIKYLTAGNLPPSLHVQDKFGYASAALRFDLDLSPGRAQEVFLVVPFGPVDAAEIGLILSSLNKISCQERLRNVLQVWKARLGSVSIHLPPAMQNLAHTFRTSAAHILINREGPALHPGPRRYSRSWIRDGVIMGAALLRAGCVDALRDFMRWYAGFQAPDGNIPDCAGQDGADWLPEFDAYGQFIFGVMEHYRFTRDKDFLEEMRPAVARTLACMENLRSKRLTQEYQTPEKKAFYGLLPESMSHEGYMAHPVHAYWDDFWGIRGFKDAADMAKILGDHAEAQRLTAILDSFSDNVRSSLAATIKRHRIDFVPGSVEFGDFDPSATSIAVGLLDLQHLLPQAETARSYDMYLEGFRKRAAGAIDWNNYTAYEIRIIGALVRLGRRKDALELLEFMLKDQRIPAWHQWPEITWRDPSGPSFIGDLPHTWISAEYILSACSLFAYEREPDQSLIIAAGLSWDWLAEGFVVEVENLPTYYGKLSYSLRLEDVDTLRLSLGGDLACPAGGIIVKPPLPRPITQVRINGSILKEFNHDSFTLRQCPSEGVVKF